MKPQEAIDNLIRKTGVSRGEAIEWLLAGIERGDIAAKEAGLSQKEFEEFYEKESKKASVARPIGKGLETLSSLAKPLEWVGALEEGTLRRASEGLGYLAGTAAVGEPELADFPQAGQFEGELVESPRAQFAGAAAGYAAPYRVAAGAIRSVAQPGLAMLSGVPARTALGALNPAVSLTASELGRYAKPLGRAMSTGRAIGEVGGGLAPAAALGASAEELFSPLGSLALLPAVGPTLRSIRNPAGALTRELGAVRGVKGATIEHELETFGRTAGKGERELLPTAQALEDVFSPVGENVLDAYGLSPGEDLAARIGVLRKLSQDQVAAKAAREAFSPPMGEGAGLGQTFSDLGASLPDTVDDAFALGQELKTKEMRSLTPRIRGQILVENIGEVSRPEAKMLNGLGRAFQKYQEAGYIDSVRVVDDATRFDLRSRTLLVARGDLTSLNKAGSAIRAAKDISETEGGLVTQPGAQPGEAATFLSRQGELAFGDPVFTVADKVPPAVPGEGLVITPPYGTSIQPADVEALFAMPFDEAAKRGLAWTDDTGAHLTLEATARLKTASPTDVAKVMGMGKAARVEEFRRLAPRVEAAGDEAFSWLSKEERRRQRGSLSGKPTETTIVGDMEPAELWWKASTNPAAVIDKFDSTTGFFGGLRKWLRAATEDERGTRPLGSWLRSPQDSFSRTHDLMFGFYKPVMEMQEKMDLAASSMLKKVQGFLKEGGIKEGDWRASEALARAADDLTYRADGQLVVGGVHPAKIVEAAKRIVKSVTVPLYRMRTGLDPRVVPILRDLELPTDLLTIKQILTLQAGPRTIPTTMLELAVEKTHGMIKVGGHYDTRAGLRGVENYFVFTPLRHEESLLATQVRELEREMALGGDPAKMARLADMLEWKRQGLEYIKNLPAYQPKKLPSREHTPKKKTEPFDKAFRGLQGSIISQWGLATDVHEVLRRNIWGTLKAHQLDDAFNRARKVFPGVEDPALKEYAIDWLYSHRGARAIGGKQAIANHVNNIHTVVGKKPNVSVEDVTHYFNELHSLVAISKLFAIPVRFLTQQVGQPMMTTYGVTGARPLFKAYAYVMAPTTKARAYQEALHAGAFANIPQNLLEAGRTELGAWERAALKLPAMSEDFNRTVSYFAGKFAAQEPGFKPSRVIKTFDRTKAPGGKWTPEMIARDYGRAVVWETQFVFRESGKPLAMTAVYPVGPMMGQFKSFLTGYTTLYKNAVKESLRKGGDKKPLARLTASLFMFGGMPAALGWAPFYDDIRKKLIREFGFVLPNKSGLSIASEMAGLDIYAPLDVSSAMDPFNFPRNWREAGRTVLGPTLSTATDIFGGLQEEGLTAKGGMRALGAASPPIAGVFRGGAELARGGVTKSPSGEVVADRGVMKPLFAALGIAKPPGQERGEIANDIFEAMMGEQVPAAERMRQEAKDKNYFFGSKAWASLKGRSTQKKKVEERPWYEQ